MFILFILLSIALIFLYFSSVEMQSHSHWLFVDNTIVWCVHLAPNKVKSVLILPSFLESNIAGRKSLVASCFLNGFCGPVWDVIMLIYNGNPYSFSAVHFLSSAVLLRLSSCLSSCLFLLLLPSLSSLPIPLAYCPGTFGEAQMCVHPTSCCELLVVFQQW